MTEPKVHGIPIHFQGVDHPDRKMQPANKSYNDLKQEWLEYLTESDAVKKAAPKIKRIEIGSLAHFTFKDWNLKFRCKKYDRVTTLNRCQEGCVDWNTADMECSADAIGEPVGDVERHKDILLDTMHMLRAIYK